MISNIYSPHLLGIEPSSFAGHVRSPASLSAARGHVTRFWLTGEAMWPLWVMSSLACPLPASWDEDVKVGAREVNLDKRWKLYVEDKKSLEEAWVPDTVELPCRSWPDYAQLMVWQEHRLSCLSQKHFDFASILTFTVAFWVILPSQNTKLMMCCPAVGLALEGYTGGTEAQITNTGEHTVSYLPSQIGMKWLRWRALL